MQTTLASYPGIRLFLTLNWDRLVNFVVLVIALLTGAYVGSLF